MSSNLLDFFGPRNKPIRDILETLDMVNANNSSQSSNQLLRPRTSSRSNPPASADSSLHFEFTPNKVDIQCTSSGEQSPVRGRTLQRVPATNRSMSCALTRHSLNPRSTRLSSDTIRERLLSRDLTAEPEEYHDESFLEPLPLEGFRSYSLSEELHRAAMVESSIDLTRFGGHKDTFAIIRLRHLRNIALDLPPTFYDSLAEHVNFNTYRAIRLCCRNWCKAITKARPIVKAPVIRLPAEVIEKIYDRLDPSSFNAARHICRLWMIVSLEKNMLIQKLRLGRWWSAARLDLAKYDNTHPAKRLSVISEDWLLSKRLATECALIPGWTGNGLKTSGGWATAQDVGRRSCLKVTSETGFCALGHATHVSHGGQEHPTQYFKVSVCQKYLLTYRGSVIYVYSFRTPDGSLPHGYGGYIEPVTSLMCPSRVLAVSMDTSSERYAIAALLEGRTGQVWNIECDLSPQKAGAGSPILSFQFSSSSTRDSTFADRPDHDRMSCTKLDAQNRGQPLLYICSSHTGIRVSNGSSSFYCNICSSQSPPYSVAICPQRRCVAFGSSAGIECHWIDVLRGQELSRWFPLSIASDFVYFLPNRSDVDTARKLRVVSSAAHPNCARDGSGNTARPSDLLETTFSRGRTWDHPSGQSEAEHSHYFANDSVSSVHRAEVHRYRAVPLSDGYSILFTDPTSGQLCLEHAAGRGQGSTQLARRFVFVGPDGVLPYTYTAGAELRWGVRIAVAYAQTLWFYSVPPDVYLSLDILNGKENGEGRNFDVETAASIVRIQGVQIGTVAALADLAVDATGGDITIWAFSSEGKALTWQIADGSRNDVVTKLVLEDGTVAVVTDGGNGDVEMQDTNFGGSGDVDSYGVVSNHQTTSLIAPMSGYQQLSLDEDGETVLTNNTAIPPIRDFTAQDREHEEGEENEGDEGYVSHPDEDNHYRHHHQQQRQDRYERGDHVVEYEQAGGQFAIHAPSIHGRGDGRGSGSGSEDWVPEYLAEHGVGIEDEGVGVDLLELMRVEIEVFGS